MKALEKSNTVFVDREKKEEYVSPGCEVYNLEFECVICNPSSGVAAGGESPVYGGTSGFPQSRNLDWD